jgi:hypothetical protein
MEGFMPDHQPLNQVESASETGRGKIHGLICFIYHEKWDGFTSGREFKTKLVA